MEADLLLELTYTGLQSCDKELLLIIEGSLSMADKKVSLEAEEALKYLVGMEVSLKGKLLICEGDSMNFESIEIKKDPNCPVCGENKYL